MNEIVRRQQLAGILDGPMDINEASKSKFEINHEQYYEAMAEAKDYIEKNGYTVSDDEWHKKVTVGPRKPANGETNRITLKLEKDGKEQRKLAHIQVYNRETRVKTYELNMYIS